MKRIDELKLFKEKHITFIKKAAQCSNHNEPDAKLLVEKARNVLGYSPNTASCDIWWTLCGGLIIDKRKILNLTKSF
jgi:hypothetical protein